MTPDEKREHLERHRRLDPEYRRFLENRIRELRFQGEEREFFFEQLPLIFLAVVALFAPVALFAHERLDGSPLYARYGPPIIIAAVLALIIGYIAAHHTLSKEDDEIREKIQANYDLLMGRK